jgi:serine/threonine protein kinase
VGQINPGLIVAGRYRLLRKLGQGGMGTVWSARNELIDREVAIKMMRPEAAANPVSLQRFFTEAKASGRLRHPNITEIFDLGQAEDGSPFLVLELLTGEPLDSVLRRVPSLAPVQTLLLGKSIAAGLNVAHAKGIVHRDLKPANIFLHRDPITLDVIPKVLDFGISKVTGPEAIDHHATHTGTVVGSPTYMSPEQARGVSDIDARADIWSVGVLLYKCLTGRAPFNAANYNALMVSIMTEPHQPVTKWVPTCPKPVSDIIDDCLKKDRADRIQSAKALIQRIDSVLLGMNAERARMELPSDEIDDDMPTIARGDRRDLVQLITATATAAQVAPLQQHPSGVMTPQPPYAGTGANGANGANGAHAVNGTPFDSPTSAPTVVSSPGLPAVTPQHISGTQVLAKTEPLDPIALAKRRDRNRLIGVIACGFAFLSLVIFLAIRFTRPSGAETSTGKGDDIKQSASKDESPKEAVKKKAAATTAETIEDLEPLDVPTTTATAKGTTTAPTATTTAAPVNTFVPTVTATATKPPAPTATATATATATTTATAKPTATATATATATTKPTATAKKPPSTGVVGPGF